uniref:Uncharacterized protein n=1 Tax=Plectus sambesii TaxID=2011161 RepID=A0A914XEC8_9BILA
DGICGAGKIVHAIIDARVPLIGHNCLIDFLYLYQYLLADLPESYESWKRTFAQPFPVVFDTRLLATRNKDKLSLHGVNSYSLESLGTYFAQSVSASHFGRQQPDLRLSDAAKKRYQCGAHYHEAGYDALMTGQVFLRMAYFAALQSAKDRPAVQSWRQILFAVRPLGNQLALSMMSTPFVNLVGPDPVYKRPNTIIVRPVKWFGGQLNAGQLKRDLDAFGRGRCDVKVLSSRCALVATNTDVTYSRVFTFLSADEKYRISTCLDDATKGLSSVCFNR